MLCMLRQAVKPLGPGTSLATRLPLAASLVYMSAGRAEFSERGLLSKAVFAALPLGTLKR